MLNIGEIYGDYECVKYIGRNEHNQKKYKMKCLKCSREKEMLDYAVTQERGIKHSSCGKGIKTLNKTFYSRWEGMRTRTTNDNYWATEHYKGRGINSDEFELFIDFYDAMYESYLEHSAIYGERDTSLERIDVNKSYSKDNCCWVTLAQQQRNKRKNRDFLAISPNGEEIISKNISKFARDNNLDRGTISDVLNGRSSHHKGWKFQYLSA